LKALRGFLENLHQQHQQLHQNDQVVDDHVADEVVNDEVVADDAVVDDAVHVAKRDLTLVERIRQNRINRLKALLGLTDAQLAELTNVVKTGDKVKIAQYIASLKLSGKRLHLYRRLTRKLLRQDSSESNSSSSEEVATTAAAPVSSSAAPVESTTPLVINDVVN